MFDFGGVLMKTVTREPRFVWDDRLGLPRGTVEHAVHGSKAWRLAQLGRLSVDAYWAEVARQLGLDTALIPQLESDYFSADQLDADLIALIREIQDAGQQVALLSNESSALRDKLTRLGIAGLFEPLVISAEIGVMKPDPAAYQAVLDPLACPPDRAVFVDDFSANIEGARAVGMIGVHYTPALNLRLELSPYLISRPTIK